MSLVADIAPLKEIQKFVWSQGDYERVACESAGAADELAAACGIGAGDDVLDVGAGTGNAAIAAARRGARVLATDITPRMVELGRARTGAGARPVEWLEADVEALPVRLLVVRLRAVVLCGDLRAPARGRGKGDVSRGEAGWGRGTCELDAGELSSRRGPRGCGAGAVASEQPAHGHPDHGAAQDHDHQRQVDARHNRVDSDRLAVQRTESTNSPPITAAPMTRATAWRSCPADVTSRSSSSLVKPVITRGARRR